MKLRPPLESIIGGVTTPCEWGTTLHWFKDIQTWSLPQLFVSMGSTYTCKEAEGSRKPTLNAWSSAQRPTSLLADLGVVQKIESSERRTA